jgi:hypothetical protein
MQDVSLTLLSQIEDNRTRRPPVTTALSLLGLVSQQCNGERPPASPVSAQIYTLDGIIATHSKPLLTTWTLSA